MRHMLISFAWVLAALAGCGGASVDDVFANGTNSAAGGSGSGGASQGGGLSAGSGIGGGTAGAASGGAGVAGGGTAGAAPGGGPNGGSGATTGGGGSGGPEDCLNGIDDDQNGAIDCADPACEPGYSCVPTPPAGALGVGWLAPSGSACPAGLLASLELYAEADLAAAPATCACACGDPGGVQCGTHVGCWPSDAECASSAPNKGVGSTCTTNVPNLMMGTSWCKASAPGAWGGTCQPSPAVVAKQPWTWAPEAAMCLGEDGGACAEPGMVCVPKPASNGSSTCVARAGDTACPAPYSVKSISFDGTVSDQRGCSGGGCACDTPAGGTCACSGPGCQVALYSDPLCAASLTQVPANDTCAATQATFTMAGLLANTVVADAGSCAPTGTAAPTGTVTPAGVVTLCCLP